MAQIGYGYGSEWQLLRFLGHHRNSLNHSIASQLGISGDFNWLDFDFSKSKKSISGDSEPKGLSFLTQLKVNGLKIINDKTAKEIENKYDEYQINNKSSWQSWDSILVVDKTIFLVEAKAHKGELFSTNTVHGGKSCQKIRKFMEDQFPDIHITDEWLKSNYQLANRLATTAFLQKHLTPHGINVKILLICFVNGYQKRIVDKNGTPKVIKKNTSKKQFENALSEELKSLGISQHASIYLSQVYIDATPNQ